MEILHIATPAEWAEAQRTGTVAPAGLATEGFVHCSTREQLPGTLDLVFRGAIGRFDFPNSSEEAMIASLRRFLSLPDALTVYPGHGPDTTVEHERATNPFLIHLR